MEESREVEGVRPEEDGAGGTSSERETEEPFERSRSGSTPEPPCAADLGGGGEEHAEEDDDGDGGHGEAVDGGDWA